MRSWVSGFFFVALGGLVLAPSVRADQITVGAPGNAASCIPFGCRDADRYQQLYASSLFPGVFTITAVSFPHTLDRMSNSIDPAEYEIRLSTTRTAPDALGVDMSSNVGADAAVVFSGALAGEVAHGLSQTFTLPVAFTFDPRNGSLLLDVVKRGGVFFGDDGIYLDYNTGMGGVSSSAWKAGTNVVLNGSAGLVTTFAGDPAPVPEPTTMVFLATGVAGVFMRRRRRLVAKVSIEQ